MPCEQRLNVKLVAEVEKRPVLYNFKMPGYTRKDETERAWSEVGKAVGMTVAECKHRWKNLRAVFVRHIKPLKTGEVAKPKRAYYLLEAMQFTLPYIKNFNDPPEPPLRTPSFPSEDVTSEGDRLPETDSDTSRQDSEPRYPSPGPISIVPSIDLSIIKKENDIQPEQSSAHVVQNNKRSLMAEDMDYSQVKKSRDSISPDLAIQESKKADALKMFLLSMLPDLQAMSDEEVRLFKRKSLEVIDDIISARLIPQVVYSSMSPSNTSGYKSEYIKTEDSD
ncbi:hypothetical protein GE061_001866 [Apolygus lucorum]|uniref:MADF domain-containing protein n=1 Tax=Apolygus lucorum TaxID=248454 RepID=A0A6A4JGP0_APOLU|nr:hypothetical protein GE061_001866 [Apolygus lucorum]